MTITYTILETNLHRLKDMFDTPVEVKAYLISGLDHFYTDGATIDCVAYIHISGYGQTYIKYSGDLLIDSNEHHKVILKKFLQLLKDEQDSETTSAQ